MSLIFSDFIQKQSSERETSNPVLHVGASGSWDSEEVLHSRIILVDTTLYGMAYKGGSAHYGTIFQIETDGTGFSLLHSFTGMPSDPGTA